MQLIEYSESWQTLVALSADKCLKPWRHAVVLLSQEDELTEKHQSIYDLIDSDELDYVLRLECRNSEGDRLPERDLELEIFRSGNNVNLILSWSTKRDYPILWQGQRPVWMDGNSGERCPPPVDAESLEMLARRLKSLFDI